MYNSDCNVSVPLPQPDMQLTRYPQSISTHTVAGTGLYCLTTEAYVCELWTTCLESFRDSKGLEIKPETTWSSIRCQTYCTTSLINT